MSFSESEGGAMSVCATQKHVACLQLLRLMDLRSIAVGPLVLLERELPGPVPWFSVASLGQSVVIHPD